MNKQIKIDFPVDTRLFYVQMLKYKAIAIGAVGSQALHCGKAKSLCLRLSPNIDWGGDE